MRLSENYRRGVEARKAWMRAHPGCSWVQATESYHRRRAFTENTAAGQPATVPATADQFERFLERVAPVTEARHVTPRPAPAAPPPPLHELPREVFQSVSRDYLARQADLRSPSWRAPGQGGGAVSPFWAGHESPLRPPSGEDANLD